MPLFHFVVTPLLAEDKRLVNKDIYLSVLASTQNEAEEQVHPLLTQQKIRASFVIHMKEENMTKEQLKQSLAVFGNRKVDVPVDLLSHLGMEPSVSPIDMEKE